MKQVIIDNRMRDAEKESLIKLGYQLIETNTNSKLYPEISAHPDIFFTKIKNKLIYEESQYKIINNKVKDEIIFIRGESSLEKEYPKDIKYNVCIIDKYAIHSFKYTDNRIKELLENEGYEFINVNQGYSKCSIAVIDEQSIIISDKGLYEKLKNYNLDILYLDYKLDIKLLNYKKYSLMNGFIGGAISRIGNNIFISGDLEKIDYNNKIKNFIKRRKLNIISFENLEVIDFGGIIEI